MGKLLGQEVISQNGDNKKEKVSEKTVWAQSGFYVNKGVHLADGSSGESRINCDRRNGHRGRNADEAKVTSPVSTETEDGATSIYYCCS